MKTNDAVDWSANGAFASGCLQDVRLQWPSVKYQIEFRCKRHSCLFIELVLHCGVGPVKVLCELCIAALANVDYATVSTLF